MSNNPLKQYFRRPAVYVKLPSQGRDYAPGVINSTETGELPVYPMTAIDEITTKTPDALFNGTAVVELIKSCVPDITDPWQISSTDLDAVLIAIKAASGSQNLEIESACPSCQESSVYNLDLVAILTTLTAPDYSVPLAIGDLSIRFGPLTYKQMNEAGLAQFDIQRSLAQVEQIQEPQQRQEATKAALVNITRITMNLIATTIRYIETPTATVDSFEHILEFMQNCDKNMYESIRDYHTQLKAQTELKPLDVKCINCEHEYKQPFTLNVSDFFG
jgi:hypothetical protein